MLWYNGGTILERRGTMVEHLSFNIAVNLTGILGMIFMLFSVGFHPSLESSHSKWLKMLMILFIGAALSDLIVCIFSGRPNAAGVLNMAFTVKMLLDSLMLLAFLAYLRGSLGMKPNQWRGGTRIIVASSIVLMLTMALNPLHQLYFTVSASQGPHLHGKGFPFLCGSVGLMFCACLYQVLIHREARWAPRFSLGFYCLVHIAALAVQPFVEGTSMVNIASLLSILVLASAYYAEQNQKYSQQALELQTTRAALVLSQIQPHFLFNSMAVVMDLCDTDPQEAKAALQELSDYLHYKISALSCNLLVSFAEDMEYLQNYLKLEKRRFGRRLQVEYDIQAQDFKVPLLTLQPLAENAVRHGLSKKPEGGTIRITTREIAEYYSILVSDDGVGFVPGEPYAAGGGHVGLSSVRSRLAILCGGSLTVRSVPGGGTTVEITIRKEQEADHENSGRG